MVLVVKNLPDSAGEIKDVGLIPRFGDPLEDEMASHSSIFSRRILWTEEPGGYSPWGSQRVAHNLESEH